MIFDSTAAVKAVKSALWVFMFTLILFIVLVWFGRFILVSGPVRLNEVMFSGGQHGWDMGYVEIHNPAEGEIDIGGWFVQSEAGSKRLFGTIKSGEYVVVYGEFMSAESEVRLVGKSGFIVDRYMPVGVEGGKAMGRVPDGSGAWTVLGEPTPGERNH
jgi:hypothetical protein